MKTPRPFQVFEYQTLRNGQDSNGVYIHFTAEPSPGIYNVVNYNDYHSLLPVTGNAHVRLNAKGKVYRNYKQAQKVLEVRDSSAIRILETAGLWMYNADDHNDSVLLTFVMMVGVNEGMRWSINGSDAGTGRALSFATSPYYTWTYRSDITDDFFVLNFLSKPGSPGNYRAGFSGPNNILLTINLEKFLPANYDVQKGYHSKETDTSHTVAIAMVPEGIELSLSNKVIVTAPYDSGNPGTPSFYPDTFRISTDLLMTHDWEQ